MAREVGLGLDSGGTQTRWAVSDADGHILGQGSVEGFSALQALTPDGITGLTTLFRSFAGEVECFGRVRRIVAGVTGAAGPEDPVAKELAVLLAAAFAMPLAQVQVKSDIELAYRSALRPGEGHLLYSGTGSVAAHMDAQRVLHRVGGRGGILDDAGSGFWIAKEALRDVWRREDEAPGCWRGSVLAQRLFDQIGGPEWTRTKAIVYGESRGRVGELALAVAEAAESDTDAAAILHRAGHELARLANILTTRFGDLPIILAGRAATLHPIIEIGLRSSLKVNALVTFSAEPAHLTAARLASEE